MSHSVYIINCPPGWLKTPPLSLVYLKTYLQSRGFSVKVLDLNKVFFQLFLIPQKDWLALNNTFENELFSLVERHYSLLIKNICDQLKNSEIVCFSLFKRNSAFTFKLIETISAELPDKPIVIGGPQTFFLDRAKQLDPRFTWVIGEGEIPLGKIAAGNTHRLYRFEEIKNLDNLPFADFAPLNLRAYSSSLPLLSSRGCYNQCDFCGERLLYQNFRAHSAGYMFELIKNLKAVNETSNFIFCDSLINHSDSWLDEFCDLLLKNDLRINWEAQMRITKNFPPALAQKMKQSGCYNLFVGLESASERVLGLMRKGFTSETALEFLQTLHTAGLHFEISLIAGFPGESDEDFQETVDFIVRHKDIIPKIAQLNPFVDYLGNFPGTNFPGDIARARVNNLMEKLKNERIKYTAGFINNLAY